MTRVKQQKIKSRINCYGLSINWYPVLALRLSTSRLSSGLLLGGGLVLVLGLHRQGRLKQARSKDVLSTKLVDFFYHCPSLYDPQTSLRCHRRAAPSFQSQQFIFVCHLRRSKGADITDRKHEATDTELNNLTFVIIWAVWDVYGYKKMSWTFALYLVSIVLQISILCYIFFRRSD